MIPSQPETVRLVIRVEGRVQGVNYRVSARRKARDLGIEAHPQNLDDGSVRIEVAGPRGAVDRFVDWCREGPPAAVVSAVTVRDVP